MMTDDENLKKYKKMVLDGKRIARLKKIASGKTINEIAVSEGVKPSTIRQFKKNNKEDVRRFIERAHDRLVKSSLDEVVENQILKIKLANGYYSSTCNTLYNKRIFNVG